jgi:hypothetical protein
MEVFMQQQDGTAPQHVRSVADIQAIRRERVVYTYTVPSELASLGISSVGLVELTAEEEQMAIKRARGDQFRLAGELVKESLREIDGKRVSLADGSVDAAWNRMPAKIRSLVLQAYAQIHNPPEGAAEGFLQSRQVRAG